MKRANFLGAPSAFNLNHACRAVTEAYGYCCYLVGSCLEKRDYRDVDVRCILPDEEFDQYFGAEPKNPIYNPRWSLQCVAISTWLRERTGLPIDFQFQKRSAANEEYPAAEHPRHAIGIFFGTPAE